MILDSSVHRVRVSGSARFYLSQPCFLTTVMINGDTGTMMYLYQSMYVILCNEKK